MRVMKILILCSVCVLSSQLFVVKAFAETSPEVLEAEKLIATSAAPATELKEPLVPGPEQAAKINETPAVETAVSAKSEAEIPVQLESVKKGATENHLLFKVLLSFSVVGLMAVGAYIFLGRYRRANLGKAPATQIKILTQHHLGPKKSLAIVRVAGESILIGITDQNISMIKSLALLDEDLPEVTPKHFSTALSTANQRQANLDSEFTAETGRTVKQQTPAEEGEDFSIAGIKDFVSSRLKNMRTID